MIASEVLRLAKDDIMAGKALTPLTAMRRHTTDPLKFYRFWDMGLSESLADPRDGQGLLGWDYWEVWDRAIAFAEAEEGENGRA